MMRELGRHNHEQILGMLMQERLKLLRQFGAIMTEEWTTDEMAHMHHTVTHPSYEELPKGIDLSKANLDASIRKETLENLGLSEGTIEFDAYFDMPEEDGNA